MEKFSKRDCNINDSQLKNTLKYHIKKSSLTEFNVNLQPLTQASDQQHKSLTYNTVIHVYFS